MGAHRTDMQRLQELARLHRLGRSRRDDVARLLGMGRDTIRHYAAALAAAGLLEGPSADVPSLDALTAAVRAHAPPASPRRQQRSKVEAHRVEIERQRQKGAQPKAIHDWLRITHPGYEGSLAAVKRLVRRLEREEGPRAEDVAIRVERPPGAVAQIDFVYAGLRFDANTRTHRRSSLFVMTMGFSRRSLYDLVFDQKAETWIRLHVRALEFFGGAPRVAPRTGGRLAGRIRPERRRPRGSRLAGVLAGSARTVWAPDYFPPWWCSGSVGGGVVGAGATGEGRGAVSMPSRRSCSSLAGEATVPSGCAYQPGSS